MHWLIPYRISGLQPPFSVAQSYYMSFFMQVILGAHKESSQDSPSANVLPNHSRVAFWLPKLNHKNTHPHQACKSLRANAEPIFPPTFLTTLEP